MMKDVYVHPWIWQGAVVAYFNVAFRVKEGSRTVIGSGET
jgi:hypothetical protein